MELHSSVIEWFDERIPFSKNYPNRITKDDTYRDALESMTLALLAQGVHTANVLDAAETAIEAYANNT